MNAHHIQRELRSLHPHHVAFTHEARSASFRFPAAGKSDVHSANGFLLASAARSGNTSDSHAEGASHPPANSFRQRNRDFHTHSAFRGNQFRRNVRPHSLHFIAVADHPAQKV